MGHLSYPSERDTVDRSNEMLICCRSGYVRDWDGELTEVTAGVSRIAPELLEERPQFGEFFEAGLSAKGSSAEARYRTELPDGRVFEW